MLYNCLSVLKINFQALCNKYLNMPTIPERKTKTVQKILQTFTCNIKIKVKIKYILFHCSANWNFKHKTIGIRFYDVQSFLSSISSKNIYFCTKKKITRKELYVRFPVPTVPSMLLLLVIDCDNSIIYVDTLILDMGGCDCLPFTTNSRKFRLGCQ